VSATVRHAIWAVTVVGVLLLLPLSWILPRLDLPILPALENMPISGGAAGTTSGSPYSEWGILAAAYGFGAAILAGRLAIWRLALARTWRRALPPQDHRYETQMDAIGQSLGLTRRVELRLGRVDQMPLTWGILHPKILLPSAARDWSSERLRIVLAHELGHVVRLDAASLAMAQWVCVLHWCNPLVWYGAARLRLEQELACDELVVRSGIDAHSYARDLLEIASRLGRQRASEAAALPIGRKSQLEARLQAIIRSTGVRRSPRASFLAILPILLCAPLAASLVPTSVGAYASPAGSQQSSATSLVLAKGSTERASGPASSRLKSSAPAPVPGSAPPEGGALAEVRSEQPANVDASTRRPVILRPGTPAPPPPFEPTPPAAEPGPPPAPPGPPPSWPASPDPPPRPFGSPP
jgi:beta-lactamase regulating signal transducer with metallopeptidase domain